MKTLLKQRRFRALPSPGFSLVETVMALGIMGLAITALLGLIPQGIEMSRKAGHASAQARIVDTIATRLGNMPFNSIDAQNGLRMFFDDQGVQVSGREASSGAVYVVEVEVKGLAAGVTLPGVAAPQPLLETVVVRIAATPDLNYKFSAVNQRTYETVPLIFGPLIP